MDWVSVVNRTIDYVEDNLEKDISVVAIAKMLYVSPFYLQKVFTAICGCSVSAYIRNRRLTFAGDDILASDESILDIAVKYGYDSQNSFAKAFERVHGVPPAAVRKKGAAIKAYPRLNIRVEVGDGEPMEYRIEKKPEFTVAGVCGEFSYENASVVGLEFWHNAVKHLKKWDVKICMVLAWMQILVLTLLSILSGLNTKLLSKTHVAVYQEKSRHLNGLSYSV